jgi:catechol 2,3-dioxygenase-like lactoylglutathione lyase family enzyme
MMGASTPDDDEVSNPVSAPNDWPSHLRVGSLRFVRSSAHLEATIAFYRDLVGLPVIDEFRDSYGEDGTIFGLPGWPNHLEIVRSHDGRISVNEFDDIVFYLPDAGAVEDATRKLRANGVEPAPVQHPYWKDWGGTTFLDPDGRKIIYVSWIYGPDPRDVGSAH